MSSAPSIDILRTVFPVVALQTDDPGQMARPDFFGTAFSVAPGVFMTAAHVVKAARSQGQLGLAGPSDAEGHPMGGARVNRVEIWEDRDSAILTCDVSNVTHLNTWLTHRAQVLTDVSAFGYPHAVTWSAAGDRLNVLFRAYKGYVVTTRGFEKLDGEPAVYEVSCPFPEGLSGAPVLMTHDGMLVVLGVVLGISTVTYGGVPQNVGIAMIGEEIFRLNSGILGGPIAARLGFAGATIQYEPQPTSERA